MIIDKLQIGTSPITAINSNVKDVFNEKLNIDNF